MITINILNKYYSIYERFSSAIPNRSEASSAVLSTKSNNKFGIDLLSEGETRSNKSGREKTIILWKEIKFY